MKNTEDGSVLSRGDFVNVSRCLDGVNDRSYMSAVLEVLDVWYSIVITRNHNAVAGMSNKVIMDLRARELEKLSDEYIIPMYQG